MNQATIHWVVVVVVFFFFELGECIVGWNHEFASLLVSNNLKSFLPFQFELVLLNAF